MSRKYTFSDEWLLRAVLALPGVTPEAVEKFRQIQEPYLAQALIRAKLASPETVAATVRKTHGVSYCDVQLEMIDKMALSLVPEKICRKHHLLPIKADSELITVAMSDPTDHIALGDVQAVSGRRPVPRYSLRERIDELIATVFSPESIITSLVAELAESAPIEILEGARGEDEERQAAVTVRTPVINLVNSLISKAVGMRASDIHLEHEEHSSSVRFRIDGLLRSIVTLPKAIATTSVVSRIKIMADLDLATHRIPQDGRAKLRVGGADIGLRVSTLPTSFGEKVVIRILDKRSAEVPFDRLGFRAELTAKMDSLLQSAQGMFLVTGPTGSGKTTTLYSILNRLKAEHTNIVTVEDPIEYKLAGINQVQVHEKAGLTFASTLRSVLRQDPDIILVGEVRDRETADVACQAALTGHLVLTTLHTNDTIAAVARLCDMGVEPFKLAPGLLAITSQRLLRRLCPACRSEVPAARIEPAARDLLERQGLPVRLYEAKGCEKCELSGFQGRFSILEFLEVDAALKAGICAGASEAELRKTALAAGILHPLTADAAWHLSNGDTTFGEVLPNLSVKEEASGPAPISPLAAAALAVKAEGRSEKLRVLVAEDAVGMRASVRDLLEMNGYEVVEACDGQQALERVMSRIPDIMILDLQMPKLDGYAVLRALRQTLQLADLPVIVLTARGDDKSEEAAFRFGADDYIVKPFRPPLLLARLQAVLNRRQLVARS